MLYCNNDIAIRSLNKGQKITSHQKPLLANSNTFEQPYIFYIKYNKSGALKIKCGYSDLSFKPFP